VRKQDQPNRRGEEAKLSASMKRVGGERAEADENGWHMRAANLGQTYNGKLGMTEGENEREKVEACVVKKAPAREGDLRLSIDFLGEKASIRGGGGGERKFGTIGGQTSML